MPIWYRFFACHLPSSNSQIIDTWGVYVGLIGVIMSEQSIQNHCSDWFNRSAPTEEVAIGRSSVCELRIEEIIEWFFINCSLAW